MKAKHFWLKAVILFLGVAFVAGVSSNATAAAIKVGSLIDATGATSDVDRCRPSDRTRGPAVACAGLAAAAAATVGAGRCAAAPTEASVAIPDPPASPRVGPVVTYTRPTTSRTIPATLIDAAIGRPDSAERNIRPESSGSVGVTISRRTHGVCARRHNGLPRQSQLVSATCRISRRRRRRLSTGGN